MLISTKGRYALRLMIDVASYAGVGTVSLREVAERQHVSLKYLEQLVRPLVKDGLLRSVRGKGGGYALGKPAAEIRAGDILRAAEGNTLPVACDGLTEQCDYASNCVSVKFWVGLDHAIEEYVDGVTLADIIREGGSIDWDEVSRRVTAQMATIEKEDAVVAKAAAAEND
jgi:Rrf2 family protein